MGNISSKQDDGAALYLRDQTRCQCALPFELKLIANKETVTIKALNIGNSSRETVLSVIPNAFPAARLSARKEAGDDTPVGYIQVCHMPCAMITSLFSQDPEENLPTFILRLDNEEELTLRFTFVLRQTISSQPGTSEETQTDTSITGLTFAHASNSRELENLVTREFHADPNLHKNSNVQLVGDFSTNGSSAVQFEWSWKWKPPRTSEDRGGGWRNSCCFLEYDQRAHRLHPLATFSFWVQNPSKAIARAPMASPRLELVVPPRYRATSSQSYQSKASEDGYQQDPPSPTEPTPDVNDVPVPTVDVSCQRPGTDLSATEDGPLFRATMKSLEQKTGNMRTHMKKVLKKAEAAQAVQEECNMAMKGFLGALREASDYNASAFKPALDHYFNQIAQQILQYETQNSTHIRKQIIDPLSRLYNLDIKQAESKKRDFEDESRDYYAYVGKYLGQRHDSMKDKKRTESDNKYQSKRRNFELKRFDYSSFMQDLHGGRKEQELLSHLTRYADFQAKSFVATAKKIEEMSPQLNALVREVTDADKEYKFHRTEREEKRRTLEKSTASYNEPTNAPSNLPDSANPPQNGYGYTSDSDLGRADSTGSKLAPTLTSQSGTTLSPSNSNLGPPIGVAISTSPGQNFASPIPHRHKGLRDVEERENTNLGSDKSGGGHDRKEGLLWALSRPGSHIDPKGMNKQAWHKYVRNLDCSSSVLILSRFWIVLDRGLILEYDNWKQKLDLHMEPIDLRMASVRAARDADRRFCFEVITPQFKRIYQATSEEDMANWILAINNALQSAVEGQTVPSHANSATNQRDPSGRDIGSALTGKSSSYSGHHGHHTRETSTVGRSITVGSRPSYVRTNSNSFDENPSKLLLQIRNADQGNTWCADCSSNSKVEWVSINLGIILCIECSGIHRSLGTHISKVRSLTLDTLSFTNDIVELLLLIGNRVSNMVWEANLDHSLKPGSTSTREQRLKFITAKYSDRAYIQPFSDSQTRLASPDDTLLASIKKNDIHGVLYGVALRANPNATDRSRNTHAVFLALAAADPAAPASATSSPGVSPNSKATPGLGAKPKAFPIAELLVQNGAEIPSQMPAIPLSSAAQLYIEQRTSHRNAALSAGGGVDSLAPLPMITRANGLATVVERENSARLQKRGSAGSRFGGKISGFGDR